MRDQVLTLILCAPVVVASWIGLHTTPRASIPRATAPATRSCTTWSADSGCWKATAATQGRLRSINPRRQRFHSRTAAAAVYVDAGPERIAAVLRSIRRSGAFDHEWLLLFARAASFPVQQRRLGAGRGWRVARREGRPAGARGPVPGAGAARLVQTIRQVACACHRTFRRLNPILAAVAPLRPENIHGHPQPPIP